MKIIAPLKYCTDGGIVIFTLTVMPIPNYLRHAGCSLEAFQAA